MLAIDQDLMVAQFSTPSLPPSLVSTGMPQATKLVPEVNLQTAQGRFNMWAHPTESTRV